MEPRSNRKITSPFCISFSFSEASGMVLHGAEETAVFWGFSVAELCGSSFAERILPEEKELLLSALQEESEADSDVEMLLSLGREDGSAAAVLMRGCTVLSEKGIREIQGVLIEASRTAKVFAGLKEDAEKWRIKLSEAENIVSSLTICAETDPLTQVLNTAATRRLAEEYLQEGGMNCALIIIDMDNFKQINDFYGHMAGDAVLIGAAKIIRKLFRSKDIVGRIGGDEFLVLVKDIAEREIITARCSQILEGVKSIRYGSIPEDGISCSVGAALFSQENNTYDAMFAAADKAMYRVKGLGKAEFYIEE